MRKFLSLILAVCFVIQPLFAEEKKPPLFSKPEELQKFMKENFKHKKDKKLFGKDDYWQTYEEFLNNLEGDCEDFAVFAEEELTKMGYPAFILNIYGGADLAHTVAVFQDGAQFGIFDEAELKYFKGDKLEQILGQYKPQAEWAAKVRPEAHHAIIVQRYKRVR